MKNLFMLLTLISGTALASDYCDIGCDAKASFMELKNAYVTAPISKARDLTGKWINVTQSSINETTLPKKEVPYFRTYNRSAGSMGTKIRTLTFELKSLSDFNPENKALFMRWYGSILFGDNLKFRQMSEQDGTFVLQDPAVDYDGKPKESSFDCRVISNSPKKLVCKIVLSYRYLADSPGYNSRKIPMDTKDTYYTGMMLATPADIEAEETPENATKPSETPAPTPAPKPVPAPGSGVWECTIDHPVIGFYTATSNSENSAKAQVFKLCNARWPSGACYLYGATCEQI